MGRIAFTAATLAMALVPLSAQAQTAPVSRTITLTYTGTVTNAASDTIKVRQPDGSLVPYTGPLPDLPYANGDAVMISFNATLPTKAFYDSGAYRGQIAADGIYRIQLSSPAYGGGAGFGGIGAASAADVSGPIDPALNSGQPTNTLMTIVYDYNTDSYAIENGGNFRSGAYSGPGYVWDATSQSYRACFTSASCQPIAGSDPILFNLFTNPDGSISTGNVRIASTDPTSGTGTGIFNWLFSGSWNLPKFGGGGPVSVPEPSMLILFGGGAAFAMARRRRRAAQPA